MKDHVAALVSKWQPLMKPLGLSQSSSTLVTERHSGKQARILKTLEGTELIYEDVMGCGALIGGGLRIT